jgi:hypothetical protein
VAQRRPVAETAWAGGRRKGGGARVGRLGPKGRAEWADSMEKEHGPQGVCGPKCKWVVETIFDFKD